MKRTADLLIAICVAVFLAFPMILITVLVKLTSKGPALYWSSRIGKNNKPFMMPKFRTMHLATPSIATHLLNEPDKYVTNIGGLLRKTSLDELPQLFSIIKGEMSFVGPRPALFNQEDLIELRTQRGIHLLTPGLTGWAQVNGRDELTIQSKVELDYYYLLNRSLFLDSKIILKTSLKVFLREGITH